MWLAPPSFTTHPCSPGHLPRTPSTVSAVALPSESGLHPNVTVASQGAVCRSA